MVINHRGRNITIPEDLRIDFKNYLGSSLSENDIDAYVDLAFGFDPEKNPEKYAAIPDKELNEKVLREMYDDLNMTKSTYIYIGNDGKESTTIIEHRGRKFYIPIELKTDHKDHFGYDISPNELDAYIKSIYGIDPETEMHKLIDISDEILSAKIGGQMYVIMRAAKLT